MTDERVRFEGECYVVHRDSDAIPRAELTTTTPRTPDDLETEVVALRAENAALRARLAELLR